MSRSGAQSQALGAVAEAGLGEDLGQRTRERLGPVGALDGEAGPALLVERRFRGR